MLNISSTSAYVILHYDLRYRKLCAKLVLRKLTDTHKEQRMELETQFLPNVMMTILVYWTAFSLATGRGCAILSPKSREKTWNGKSLLLQERSL